MTAKKKHLIELMIEAGVKWPDGAEYAAQDKDEWLAFYTRKPYREEGKVTWSSNRCYVANSMKKLDSLCRNWHQTIVTREQYADALAATAMTPVAQKETQPAPQYCTSVMRQMPDNTIEQLTADYRAKATEADRLQAVADDALKAADDALIALEKAGELIGLIISIDTKPKQVDITDWLDLRVGDVIECVPYGDERDDASIWPGGWAKSIVNANHTVGSVDPGSGKITLLDAKDSGYAFRFIRRP